LAEENNLHEDDEDWTAITWLGDATHTPFEPQDAINKSFDPPLHKADYYSFKLGKSALNTLVNYFIQLFIFRLLVYAMDIGHL